MLSYLTLLKEVNAKFIIICWFVLVPFVVLKLNLIFFFFFLIIKKVKKNICCLEALLACMITLHLSYD